MTVFASCADAIPAPSANNNTSIIHVFLAIIPPAVFPTELLCLDLGVRADYTSVGRLAHPLRIDWMGPVQVRHLRMDCRDTAQLAQRLMLVGRSRSGWA